jgi:hypothetical protein
VTVTRGIQTAFAGILTASRRSTGDPTNTTSYLLPAFAAFLGSNQFTGGRFNVLGRLVAVAVLAVGLEGLQPGCAPVWTPNLFNGVVLLLALGFAQVLRSPRRRTAAIRRTIQSIGGSAKSERPRPDGLRDEPRSAHITPGSPHRTNRGQGPNQADADRASKGTASFVWDRLDSPAIGLHSPVLPAMRIATQSPNRVGVEASHKSLALQLASR